MGLTGRGKGAVPRPVGGPNACALPISIMAAVDSMEEPALGLERRPGERASLCPGREALALKFREM